MTERMPDDDGKKKKKKKKVSTIRFDLFTKAGKFIFKVLRNIKSRISKLI